MFLFPPWFKTKKPGQFASIVWKNCHLPSQKEILNDSVHFTITRVWRKHLVIFARWFWRFKMSLHIQETKNWQRSVIIYMYIVLQEEFCNYFFFLKSCASKNLFWSHIEWESFLSNSTDFITIIYYQTMRMTLVWEQKLHLFIRKYCKGYTYVEGTMAFSGFIYKYLNLS